MQMTDWQKNADLNEANTTAKADILSQMILEMEIKSLELNSKLENIINKMTKDLPKVAKEISVQKEEIGNFKSVIESARGVVNSQNIKATSLQSLSVLDRALDRIKTTQLFLKDADNWNTVSAEMESLFAAQDYEKASVRLVEAEKSFQTLVSNPNGKNITERKDLLRSLRSTLLGLLRGEVSAFIHDKNVSNVFLSFQISFFKITC
jgi:hypothetical protein